MLSVDGAHTQVSKLEVLQKFCAVRPLHLGWEGNKATNFGPGSCHTSGIITDMPVQPSLELSAISCKQLQITASVSETSMKHPTPLYHFNPKI